MDRREALPETHCVQHLARDHSHANFRTTAYSRPTRPLGWKLFNAGIDGNLSGTAQIVTMMDSGLNTNMEHFAEDTSVVGTIGAAHRKVVGYDSSGQRRPVRHQFRQRRRRSRDLTSQHAVGSISNMTTNPDVTHVPTNFWDPGIARDAKVYFQDIGAAGSALSPADLGTSITLAIGKGSFIQNHSWSAATNTYITDADEPRYRSVRQPEHGRDGLRGE
mgnify:CR=1 FL=1